MRRGDRLYGALLAAASVLLSAAGILATIYTVASFVGPFRSAVPSFGASAGVVVRAGKRDAGWTRALADEGPRTVADGLDRALGPGLGVVVVPDGRELEPSERIALRRYLEGGGGAVIGLRGVPAAAAAGLDANEQDRTLPAPAGARALPADAWLAIVAHRAGPLSAALAVGTRVSVTEARRVGLADASGEICWAPAAGDPSGCTFAAAARQELGRGRLVWLAVAPDDAAESPDARAALERVARAAVAWAGRRPFVELRPPEPGSEGVRLRAEDVSAARVLIHVSNTAAAEARDVVVRVHLNARGRRIRVADTILFQSDVTEEPASDGESVDLRLPLLPAGITRSFAVDLRDGAAE